MRGPQGEELPGAILFVCTLNAVRSPMAAGLMRYLYGKYCFVESAGAQAGQLDPMAAEVMEEMGIDISAHVPRSLDDLPDANFDLVVTLSAEGGEGAAALARRNAIEVEAWPAFDPTAVEGTREQRLAAYRALRDDLLWRIRRRFGKSMASDT